MNYYPHHIGDYTKDTAHLSMLEDGAYRRMMDVYYSTERPLPLESGKLYRLVRAQTTAERKAVDTILGEYFERRDDGWHQKRIDAEIAVAHEQTAESRDKRENEKQRQKQHRERRRKLFEELRAHGLVPSWDTPTSALQTMLDGALSRVTSQTSHTTSHSDSHAPVTRTATATQSQSQSQSQSQVHKNQAAAAPPPDPLWGDGLSVLTAAGLRIETARSFIGRCLKEWDASTVLDALREARGTADPKGYAMKLLAGKQRKNSKPEPWAGAI